MVLKLNSVTDFSEVEIFTFQNKFQKTMGLWIYIKDLHWVHFYLPYDEYTC